MTKKQRREHKLGNQIRKLRLLKLYFKTKPSKMGWIEKPGFIQDGRFTAQAKAMV